MYQYLRNYPAGYESEVRVVFGNENNGTQYTRSFHVAYTNVRQDVSTCLKIRGQDICSKDSFVDFKIEI